MIIDILIWSVVFLSCLGIGWAVDEDHWILGTVLTVLGAWGMTIWTKTPVIEWMKINWFLAIKYAVAYILIGILWSLMKFYVQAGKITADYLVANSIRNVEEQSHQEFKTLFAKVPTWIAFWPLICLWDIVSDFLRSFFQWIARQLASVYSYIFMKVTFKTLQEAQERFYKENPIAKDNPFNRGKDKK